MNTHKKSRKLGFLGAVLALSLSLLGMGTANAEETPSSVGNIDTTQTGSLTIHKYDGAAGTKGKGNKLEETDPALIGHNKLDGAGFTVHPILHQDGTALNLKEQAEWKVLASLPKAFADEQDVNDKLEEKGLKLGDAKPEVVTKDGEATVSNLSLSAYAVFETKKPDKATSVAAPFILTIPFPNTTSGNKGWLYDVHVYPKNQITDTPKKEVDDATPTVNVGTELLWTVTGKVPTPTKAGEKLQAFRFNDTLDSNLKCGKTAPTVIVSGQQINAADDYEYSCKDEDPSKVVINFTKTYLDTLNGGETIKITFSSTVAKIPEGKEIPNKEYNFQFKNNGDTEFNTVPPSSETPVPKAYFGDFNILKVSDDKKTTLKDAEFMVYAKLTPEGAVDETSVVKNSDGEGLVYKSGQDGLVKIEGLYRGDEEVSEKKYYVVETKAPAGFKDPTGFEKGSGGPTKEDPLPITISKDSGKDTNSDQTVINNPYTDDDVPNLPLTGAQGKVLLTLAGLAVLALAAGTAFKTRSHKN